MQALGNLDPHIHFAILSDFRDAATETLPRDAEILAAARAGIEALNAQARAADGPTASSCSIALRQWNEQRRAVDGMGAQARQDRGVQPPAARRDRHQLRRPRRRPRRSCREVRYCITLDSDTRLPRDAARQLIGIITHPLNRPTFDPRLGRVTEGYGILQPRVSVTFTSAAGSLFARLYAGHTGVDPYTTAVSDTYQDLFGEGIFTGKGLYDVDAFMAALEDSRSGERAAVARSVRGAACARGARLGRGARRRVSRRACSRTPGASIAGSAATGRSCSGCFRSCPRGAG